jgi:hypothetical protein
VKLIINIILVLVHTWSAIQSQGGHKAYTQSVCNHCKYYQIVRGHCKCSSPLL